MLVEWRGGALTRVLLASTALAAVLLDFDTAAAEPMAAKGRDAAGQGTFTLGAEARRILREGLTGGPAVRPISTVRSTGFLHGPELGTTAALASPTAAGWSIVEGVSTRSAASASAGSIVVSSGGRPAQAARWSPSYPTFNYLTDNTNNNFTSPADRPWMATRPQLDNSFTADQTREFNANWGNLAVGQAAALNRGLIGTGVTVAVIDTGVDATYTDPDNPAGGFNSLHPEFIGRLDTRSARARDDGSVDGLIFDQLTGSGAGHGTHVAGIIAANQDGAGSVGVAPGARLLAIKGLGAGNDTDAGLFYAAEQAEIRIINGSYGPIIPPQSTTWHTEHGPCPGGCRAQEFRAVSAALGAGKLLVFANGNDGEDSPIQARNPSGIALFPFVRPGHAGVGAYDDAGVNYDFSSIFSQPGRIIAVANVGVDLRISADSNRCGVAASWCLSGPGGGVADLANLQNGILATVPRAADLGILPQFGPGPDNTGYSYFTGTSMAAPHVSGVAAVLMGAYPAYSTGQIADLMFSTAQDLGAPGIDVIYGHGLVRLDRAISGPTTLAAAADVAVAAAQTTYWSQPLVTDGGFTKSGEGILTISGQATAQGAVTVNAGTFAVDGRLIMSGGALTVGTGGAVAGFGTITGSTTIGGLLSPGKMANVQDLIDLGFLAPGASVIGNSPGTLTFSGNVMLLSSATTRIDVDGSLLVPGGPGTYDRVVVTGAGHVFAANGTLSPVLRGVAGNTNTFTPVLGEKFTIVDAQGGATVTGSFTGMTQPTDGLSARTRFDVLYGSTSLSLVVTPLAFKGVGAGGANGRSVATALDGARPAAGVRPSAAQAQIFDPLYGLTSAAAYGNAFDGLSGQGQAAVPGAVLGAFGTFGGAIADRQSSLLGGGAMAQLMPSVAVAYSSDGPVVAARGDVPPQVMAADDPVKAESRFPPAAWSIWGQAYGRWASVGASAGLPGANSTAGGFVVGVDRLWFNDLIGGAAVGFTRTSTGSAGTTATSDTYAGALYASWVPGAWVVDGRLAAGPARISSSRSITFPGISASATGSATGWGLLAASEVGYRIVTAFATLKPYAGLSAQSFTRRSFAESGAFGLTFPEQTFSKLTSTVGVTATTTARIGGVTVVPTAKIAWLHDLRDESLVTQAAILDAPFAILAAAPGRDGLVLGLGVSAWQRETLRVFGSYTGELRSNAASHEITGGIRVLW